MAKVERRSHKHFVWDASVSTVLHPWVDQVPKESFLQRRERGRGGKIGIITPDGQFRKETMQFNREGSGAEFPDSRAVLVVGQDRPRRRPRGAAGRERAARSGAGRSRQRGAERSCPARRC